MESADRTSLAAELAAAFMTSPWKQDALAEAGSALLGRWPDWMMSLAFSVLAEFRFAPVDQPERLRDHIDGFLAARAIDPAEEAPRGRTSARLTASARRRGARVPVAPAWPVAAVESVSTLAGLLELSLGQLEWLADVRALERRVDDERLRNYRYALVRRSGGVPRVIEAPKLALKSAQRWILRRILDVIPTHPGCHGFVRTRSVITHAHLHSGQAAVLRLDLSDFFASVSAGRVFGIFATAGYPPAVAHVLTGLCTNAVPPLVWNALPPVDDPRLLAPRFRLGRQLATPHLPQGAPTSPALANLAAHRLDCRLAGLAAAAGLTYSRYADDLTFSGPDRLRRRRLRLEARIADIVRDEGFAINPAKSRLSVAASRQSVCGVTVNAHPNIARPEFDQLKAILHNAARDGPARHNRDGRPDFEAHLRGRIAWVGALNPARGAKLRRIFEQIDWGA